MNLEETVITAKKEYSGNGIYTVSDGQSLKIESSPGGEEILNMKNTSGSDWDVHITVKINEVST
jgi:hypothetical protein